MNTRYALLALVATLGLSVSAAMAQTIWEPNGSTSYWTSAAPSGLYSPPTAYQAPVDHTPVYRTPVTPVYQTPVYRTAAAPVYQPPVYQAPAYTGPVHPGAGTMPGYVTTYNPAPQYTTTAFGAPRVCCAQPAVSPVYRPVTTYINTPVMTPVVHRPVITSYAAARPPVTPTFVTSYTQPAPVPVAVATGPRVWVNEKVYVEGQPIRNLIKAFTP